MPVIACFYFPLPPPDLELPLAIRASSSVGASPQVTLVPKWQRSDGGSRGAMEVRVSTFPYILGGLVRGQYIFLITRPLSILPLKVSSFVRLRHTSIIFSIAIVLRHHPIVP
jgi:hypothetical protein